MTRMRSVSDLQNPHHTSVDWPDDFLPRESEALKQLAVICMFWKVDLMYVLKDFKHNITRSVPIFQVYIASV